MIKNVEIPKLALSIPEAEKVTSLHRNLLYKEINTGRLHAVKVGRRTLIPYASIQDWLSKCPSYSQAERGQNG